MSKTPLSDFIPAVPAKKKLFQTHVDPDLLSSVRRQMAKDGMTIRTLVEASMRRYLAEAAKGKVAS